MAVSVHKKEGLLSESKATFLLENLSALIAHGSCALQKNSNFTVTLNLLFKSLLLPISACSQLVLVWNFRWW